MCNKKVSFSADRQREKPFFDKMSVKKACFALLLLKKMRLCRIIEHIGVSKKEESSRELFARIRFEKTTFADFHICISADDFVLVFCNAFKTAGLSGFCGRWDFR